MKTTEKELQKKALKIAYNYCFNKYEILKNRVSPNRKINLDRRYKVNQLAINYIKKIRATIDFTEIRLLQKERRIRLLNNQCNILQNHIVKDWIENKNMVKSIDDEKISFYGRNHWAKNDRDVKILEILSK